MSAIMRTQSTSYRRSFGGEVLMESCRNWGLTGADFGARDDSAHNQSQTLLIWDILVFFRCLAWTDRIAV